MQASNHIQKALKKGGASFGAWHMLPGSNVARTLARTGVDWVLVDTEHGNIDDGQMHESVAAIAACGVSPLVRIAANEPWMVKRALDAGAHGIMVPLLQTAAEAKRLVSSAKFPPKGMRGFGSPFAQTAFPGITTAAEYLQQANDTLLTIVQIETKEALANIDEIAAVDGVDVLFVGPFDLGNNIGRPYVDAKPHEELATAIAKVREAASKAGKYSGIYCTSGTQAREYADTGFQMISFDGDMIALQSHVSEQLNVAKGSIAHSAYQGMKGMASKLTGPYGQ